MKIFCGALHPDHIFFFSRSFIQLVSRPASQPASLSVSWVYIKSSAAWTESGSLGQLPRSMLPSTSHSFFHIFSQSVSQSVRQVVVESLTDIVVVTHKGYLVRAGPCLSHRQVSSGEATPSFLLHHLRSPLPHLHVLPLPSIHAVPQYGQPGPFCHSCTIVSRNLCLYLVLLLVLLHTSTNMASQSPSSLFLPRHTKLYFTTTSFSYHPYSKVSQSPLSLLLLTHDYRKG